MKMESARLHLARGNFAAALATSIRSVRIDLPSRVPLKAPVCRSGEKGGCREIDRSGAGISWHGARSLPCVRRGLTIRWRAESLSLCIPSQESGGASPVPERSRAQAKGKCRRCRSEFSSGSSGRPQVSGHDDRDG
jgi:hypothetical protein